MSTYPRFIEILQPARKRIMAELMLTKRNWSALENLIEGEDASIKSAYAAWKRDQSLQPPAADPIVNIPNQSFRQPGIRASEPVGLAPVTRRLTTMNVESPFFDRLPRETTIVLLSETGTGKSTFVNSIVNYLLYETLNEAIDKGVQILIRTCFSHTSDHIPQIRIDLPPNLFTDSTTENEITKLGESSTQAAHSYVFKFGPAGNEKKITIIDTPGVGDVSGLENDTKNFHNTLAFLSKYRSINAFCILLKPNLSSLTVSFRFCINELLSALHVSVTNNILFCMTNTRATNYRTGETIPTLKVEMKKLKEKRGITIPISRETVFCFENDCYRLLCEVTYGIKYSKETIDSFSPSWNHSMAETYKMFEQIIKLKPHNMKETLSVSYIRAMILSLSRPLSEIVRNQKYNEELIKDQLKLKDRHQEEMNMISKASVEFAAFLQQNSITGYNYAYLEYLDLLIQQESYKTGQGGNNQVMEKLKQIRSDYKQQIELMDTHGAKSSCTKSLAELYEIIENLRNLEFYGQILKDVELLEMKSTNYKDDSRAVSFNSLPKMFIKIVDKTK